MRTSSLISALIGLLLFSTTTVSATESMARKTALSGKQIQVAFVFDLNPDCSSRGYPTIKVIQSPAHGKLADLHGVDFPKFLATHRLAACNVRKVVGEKISYTSNKGYVGDDRVILDVFFNDGSEWVDTIEITVK